MQLRRFTSVTNGFSKTRANLKAMLALYFRVLQLLPDSRLAPRDASDGGGNYRSRVGGEGTAMSRRAREEGKGMGAEIISKYFKGPNVAKYSCNPFGRNPGEPSGVIWQTR